MKHLAVLTSGGDAPGMNAAIRAVVRTAVYQGLTVSGVYRGYQGLISGDIQELGPRSVANIIERGGTMLRSARNMPFMTPEGRAQAAENLKRHDVEGLVVIGGDGSFRGAHALYQEHKIAVIGVPGTIDNDIYGTDATIGYNTALGVALDAVDRLRDTAESHDRLFLVEVMGRHAGHIALNVGLAGGAAVILLPEVEHDVDEVVSSIVKAHARGKTSVMVVVAEGAHKGGGMHLKEQIEAVCGYEVRTSILGHMQRGGSPTTCDRVLASRLGYAAVHGLLGGQRDVMVGVDKHETVFVPLQETWEKQKGIDWQLFEIAKVLAV